jgi:hypothetical protein
MNYIQRLCNLFRGFGEFGGRFEDTDESETESLASNTSSQVSLLSTPSQVTPDSLSLVSHDAHPYHYSSSLGIPDHPTITITILPVADGPGLLRQVGSESNSSSTNLNLEAWVKKIPVSAKELSELPADILHCITDFLPNSSACSLTLCSHTFLRKLGTRHFKAINRAALDSVAPMSELPTGWQVGCRTPGEKDRELFIKMLDLTLPTSIYCYYCRKLHDPEMTDSGHFINDQWRACTRVEESRTGAQYIHSLFNYSRIQSLMKVHQRGFVDLESMDSLTLKQTSYRKLSTLRKSIKPRIRSGKLLLRSQYTLLLATDDSGEIVAMPQEHDIELCAHYFTFFSPSRSWWLLDNIIQCSLSHQDDPKNCPGWQNQSHVFGQVLRGKCTGLISCPDCCTEFEMAQNECEATGNRILVFTAWQDLGEGKTPYDPKWMRRFSMNPSPHLEPCPYVKGSIKQAYEAFDITDHMGCLGKSLVLKQNYSPDVYG